MFDQSEKGERERAGLDDFILFYFEKLRRLKLDAAP
jgi:hypothetical protein